MNIYKDSIKNAAALPPLPNDAALMAMLVPSFHALSTAGKEGMHSRPMYAITDAQKQAAEDFLSVRPLLRYSQAAYELANLCTLHPQTKREKLLVPAARCAGLHCIRLGSKHAFTCCGQQAMY